MNESARRRLWPKLLALTLFLGTVALGLVVWNFWDYLQRPGPTRGAQAIRVHIPAGSSLHQIIEILAANGVISQPEKFRYLVEWKGLSTRIQAGEFEFEPGMRPEEVLAKLVAGQPVLHALTVPEGYHLVQIAGVLDQTGIWSGEQFLTLARDPAFAASLGIPYSTLEGYLFPDTYKFPRSTPETEIIRAMFHRMEKEFPTEEAMRGLGLSRHQVLTLASIVEKETGRPQERPLIASVFLNRLRRGMRLDSDPTVIYGLNHFNGNLTRQDLETWTPYNTYRIAGLPPGPIASPGHDAIQAVLHAPATNYLFFVSRGDGTHEFTQSYREHQQAVDRYQRRDSR